LQRRFLGDLLPVLYYLVLVPGSTSLYIPTHKAQRNWSLSICQRRPISLALLPCRPVEHSTIYHGSWKSKRDISRKESEKVGTTAQVTSESRWSNVVVLVGCGTNSTCADLLTRFPHRRDSQQCPTHVYIYACCMSIIYIGR
jgi:hypothetical protein